jgi:hypothetical protein
MAPPADQYVVYRGQYLTVEFYYTQAGQIPAREFYVLQAEEERTRFFHIVQHLTDNPPGIQLPKTMFNMEDEEERIFGIKPYSGRYLGFYTRDRRFVITVAFEKQTQKLGARERQHVQTAIIRKQDYLARTAVRTYYRPALPPRRRKT